MSRIFRKVFLVFCLATFAEAARAQLLSVDVNGTVRSDVNAPGFTPWYLAADLVSPKRTVTRTFTNSVVVFDPDTGLPTATNITGSVSCTVAQTFPNPAVVDSTIYLNANYANKNGNSTSTDPSAGYRLCADAVWTHQKNDALVIDRPYTNGGAFSLTLSNLTAGTHTITTYHNDLWGSSAGGAWHTNFTMSRCVISVGGVPVFTNTPTFYATNDTKCGFAFFTVSNSFDGQPVVINFDPDHSSVLDYVVLNGFEIDRPAAPGSLATAIFPSPGDEHVFANNDVPLPGTTNAGLLTLNWLPAGFAISNQLYFGTSQGAVANATVASPEFIQTSAAVVGATNTFAVTNLNSALTYYWRVDQLNIANGVTNLVAGTVWKFRTRHLAFPTAEGYGRFARGGRGGVVIEVTNLNDSGPGSFRAAIAASGPRTVVFKVSGLIRLQSTCNSGNGYVTIAGQTAPGDGICFANWRVGMASCSDAITRFVRVRLGDASQQAMDGLGLGNCNNSIIDHCSISWTMDEASSSRQSGGVGSQSAMITFQHNIISEPLQHSYHYLASNRTNYEQHAFAASISGEIGSYHHNLIAHSTDRNWSLAGGLDQPGHYAGSLDIRNNVVYNWLGRSTDGGVARLNNASNYFKPFPSNPYATFLLRLDPIDVTNRGYVFYFMGGNVMEGKNYQTNNWSIGLAVAVGNGTNNYASSNQVVAAITNLEIFPSYVASQTASNAYRLVMSDVGCNLPVPDAIDRRVIGEVLDTKTHYTGTNGNPYIINGIVQPGPSPNYPGFIDSQTDVKDFQNTNAALANYSTNAPWPPYYTFNVPMDSDHDGMPDWWELAKGLNPNSAAGDFSDSNGDPDGDGYSNLEDYLNWLAVIHVDGTRGTNLDLELTQFTRGFTNSLPTYAVSNPTNGTVTIIGSTAHFTPTVNFYGLGSFQFKVTDAQNVSLTNTVGVHVRALPASQLTATNVSGGLQVQFTGENGLYYLIQTSDDLKSWMTWTNVTAPATPKIFTAGILNPPARFYRAVSIQ